MKNYILLLFTLFVFQLTAVGQAWVQQNTSNDPTARTNASAVYMESTNELILFGGRSGSGYENELWSLDLTSLSWSPITSNSTSLPDARHTHEAYYDPVNHRMIIWGGQGTTGLYNDVWAFNFSDSSWAELFSNGNIAGAPLRRYGTGSVYLPDSNRLVSFAGFTTSGRFDDTWAFDLQTQQWSDLSQTQRPGQRCLFNSTWLSDSNKMVIFGGQSSSNLNDLWSLDLSTYNWTELSPIQQPSARHYASLTNNGQELLLFGGNASGQNVHSGGQNDLWRFDWNTMEWDTLNQGLFRPAKRSGHLAVMISETKMLVYGGHLTNGSKNDEVWILDLLLLGTAVNKIQQQEFALYPNPARNVLKVKLENQATIEKVEIFNLYGQLIWSQKQYQSEIDIQFLENGQYYLRMWTKSGEQLVNAFIVSP